MSKLTCDDCGTVNDERRGTCELCGESLREEAGRRQKRSLFVLVPVAVMATYAIVVLPGVLLSKWIYTAGGLGRALSTMVFEPFEVLEPRFWAVYAGVWVVLFLISFVHEPRSDYELGGIYSMGRDSQFQPRNFEDRIHFAEGCLVMPVMVLRNLWAEVFERAGLTSR